VSKKPPPSDKEPKRSAPRRPVRYTEEIGDAICEALARGERLKAICSNTAMPAASTVRKWVLDPEHPLTARYDQARKIGIFEIVDQCLELADNTKDDFLPGRTADGRKVADEKAISRVKLQIETRRWYASKALPGIFGDRVEMTGKDGGPIAIEAKGLSDLEASRRMVLMLFEQLGAESGTGEVVKLLNGNVPHDQA
jgi:hypothetical protein